MDSFSDIDTIKLALIYLPEAYHGDQRVLWEALFCSKSRMALRGHRGALLMPLSVPLSLAAHIVPVFSKPSYCCHQDPLHPHFHLYPIFHFISMLISEDKKAHVMAFIVMQLVYLSTQGENQGDWPQGMASPSSKLHLLNQRQDVLLAGLFGILMIKISIRVYT